MTALAIILGTLVSEDLTCVAVGLLIRRGELDALTGIVACFAGIYAGDLGVWISGRLAGLALLSKLRAGRFGPRVERFSQWFDENAAAAVFASRFLPGMRLPLRLAMGAVGRRSLTFIVWSGIAAAVWTPLLVGAAALFGDAFVRPFEAVIGSGWLSLVGGALALLLVLRLAVLLASRTGRASLAASLSRIWRWEFWPPWIFYPPVVVWVLLLALRHRGFSVVTAANPGIPTGGFVGESKQDILAKLPREWTLASRLIEPGSAAERLNALRQAMAEEGWSFPLILKPDVGQRGCGVRVIRNDGEAEAYLGSHEAALVAQAYHPGPFEAGIFYYRYPGEPAGRIFSITDKFFPSVTGDGRSTLSDLIWAHPRYRMQAARFLARHERQLGRIPAAGEVVPLGLVGNHVQGTMFRDGAHLITPALERRVDAIARRFDGFYVGRFDVRYADVEAFKAGDELAIVELNGVTSESTNIYDPSKSLFWAYGTLFRQWAIIFRIAALNRARGVRPTSGRALASTLLEHFRRPAEHSISD
jgi:membrane protein DedA with SNARE-associated domain